MIFFRPGWDRNTASSRLRVWNIQPHIKDAKVGIADKYRTGDVLVIQKVPDINELQKAQKEGAKVVYDIDDYYWDKTEFRNMVKDADLVTVDTEEKAKRLGFCGRHSKPAIVIPDSLDWDGTKKEQYGQGVIGWTGYGNNSQYLNPIIAMLPAPLRLITTTDWLDYIDKAHNEKMQSRPWSLAMVDKYMSECDLGIYYLPDGEFEQVKGMHKLLKNWAIGLPTYTSPMPDYVKAMKEAGVGEQYLVKQKEDWKNIQFVPFDEKLRDYAMRYEAKEVAKLWTTTIESL